jgi:hypothetical protein
MSRFWRDDVAISALVQGTALVWKKAGVVSIRQK